MSIHSTEGEDGLASLVRVGWSGVIPYEGLAHATRGDCNGIQWYLAENVYVDAISTSLDMVNTTAVEYLSSLLGKQLRIHTTDTRMFVGEMKCTDSESNVILSRTHEYRAPPASAIQSAGSAMQADVSSTQKSFKMDMTSRFLGLVVVPGEFITKIELEEYMDVDQSTEPS